jgi:predicted DNA-binding transcriptional regulator AlpA
LSVQSCSWLGGARNGIRPWQIVVTPHHMEIQVTSDFDPVIPRRQAREQFLGGISDVTLWRWERAGKLPPPIRISRNVQGWRKSTLEQFLAERMDAVL